jgi:GNAT superfamily N-acetyltransferase
MFNPKEFAQALLHIRRLEGWRSALIFLTLPVFEYHHAYAYRRSLAEPIKVRPVDGDLTLRSATPDDRQLFETIFPKFRIKRLIEKMEAGEMCVIAIHQDRIIGTCWAGFANGPSVRDTALSIKADEAYLWGAFTLPEFRSRGVVSALANKLMIWLQEHGYAGAYQVINRGNASSRKVAQKIGSDPVGEVLSVRLFKWKYKRYTSLGEPAAQTTESQIAA